MPSRHPYLLLVLAMALHLAVGLAWVARDRVVRDGDEEGHVGAAELVAARWMEGDAGGAVALSLVGPLGDYPPLYAGAVGGWWALHGGGDPARVPVRGLNLAWPLVAAAAVAALARRAGPRAALVAGVAALLLPLPAGLGRHFMPEGLLVAAVSLAVLAVERARVRPGVGSLVMAGVLCGVALLVKQTALLVLAPVLVLRLPRRWGALLVPLGALVVVGPWLLPRLAEQWAYGAASVERGEGPGVLVHLGFYPWSLAWVGAGPPLAVLALAGLVGGLRTRHPAARDLTGLAVAWLGGTLLLLLFVPLKYPRLMAPALPAVALLVGVAATRLRGVLVAGALAVAAAWWLAGSWIHLPLPRGAQVLDARCPQAWVRPPLDDDLGLGAVVAAVRRAPPGPVGVLDPPAIPCAVRTTFDWDAHLGPALRRGGADREILAPGDVRRAAVLVDWRPSATGGTEVQVPALDRSFRIRAGE